MHRPVNSGTQKGRQRRIAAQQNLHALLMNRPVHYIDEKGERVFLDDAAHKAEIERQRQLVQDNCDNE